MMAILFIFNWLSFLCLVVKALYKILLVIRVCSRNAGKYLGTSAIFHEALNLSFYVYIHSVI